MRCLRKARETGYNLTSEQAHRKPCGHDIDRYVRPVLTVDLDEIVVFQLLEIAQNRALSRIIHSLVVRVIEVTRRNLVVFADDVVEYELVRGELLDTLPLISASAYDIVILVYSTVIASGRNPDRT